jgi:hypothetical protein
LNAFVIFSLAFFFSLLCLLCQSPMAVCFLF